MVIMCCWLTAAVLLFYGNTFNKTESDVFVRSLRAHHTD